MHSGTCQMHAAGRYARTNRGNAQNMAENNALKCVGQSFGLFGHFQKGFEHLGDVPLGQLDIILDVQAQILLDASVGIMACHCRLKAPMHGDAINVPIWYACARQAFGFCFLFGLLAAASAHDVAAAHTGN